MSPCPTYSNLADTDLIHRLQELTLEPVSSSSMLTIQFGGPPTSTAFQNVIFALDEAQKDFVRDTGIVSWHTGWRGDTNTGVAVTAQTERVVLPQDMMDVRRRAWIGFGGSYAAWGPAFYLVNDQRGMTFKLTINDSAVLATTPYYPPSLPDPLYLNASGNTANTFKLIIDSTEHLATQPGTYDSTQPLALPLQSPTKGWNLFMYNQATNVWVLAANPQTLQAGQAQTVQELPTQDSWTSDSWMPNWESNFSQPIFADESLAAIPGLYLGPPSSDAGQIDVLYTPVANALASSGLPLSVPPDFSPAIVWKALAILLTAETEGNDPQRARYCLEQYNLYVRLAKSILFMPNMVQLGGQ